MSPEPKAPRPLPPPSEPSPPAPRRERARLAVLVALTVVWLQPWLGGERGPHATGAPALLALSAAWGLALTTFLARTRRGLGHGEAAVAAAVAGALTALLAARHPWIAGPDPRASWTPIFAPLALLGVLDLAVRLRRVPEAGLGREITAIRGGSALLACAALVVALAPLPAATAAFLGALPFLVHWARGARRALEAFATLAAAVLVAAPDAEAATRPPAFSAVAPTLWPYAWRVLSLALVGLGIAGVASPEGRPDERPSPSRA